MARTPISGRLAMRSFSKQWHWCSACICQSRGAAPTSRAADCAKYAVREVRDHLPDNRFVLRTDAKSYYASIDHLLLLDQLAVHLKDQRVLDLIGQYLRRTSERGGSFLDYEKGISLGLPYPFIGIQNNSDVRFRIVDWSGVGSIGGNFAQT